MLATYLTIFRSWSTF